ncbi:hypothetical protein MMC21_000440 [Puttea exsequens]|nr:hypothetical protein [Puttea exsequens]
MEPTIRQFWPSPWGFQRRRWRVGAAASGLLAGSFLAIAFYILAVLGWGKDGGRDATGWAWIDVIDAFGFIKLVVTVVKYIPQVRENYKQQSTVGWNIHQILLDVTGGVLSLAQLIIDSSLRGGDFRGVLGNPVKFGLGNISIFFDVIFMIQHYVLYRGKRKEIIEEDGDVVGEDEGLLARAESSTSEASAKSL